jgi:8-oxo-dGTP pyrophosphatase MutT (NUDIX family)
MKIVEKDGHEVVKFENPGVAVICYEIDQSGVLSTIGIVKETNPLFETGYSENLIMGTVETEDNSLLERAMKELKEEAGLEITDSTKWFYLGELYTSKVSPDPIYLFSVNVSGITPQPPTGDSTDKIEKIISFSMIPAQDILRIGDSILLASFFKLFMKIYNRELKPVNI